MKLRRPIELYIELKIFQETIGCALTLLVSFFLGLLVPAYLSTRKNESTVLSN